MTNQTDIDALIAKNAAFRDATTEHELPSEGSIIGLWMATAAALESTAAELRQERERADTWWKAALTVEGDLNQARARTEAMRIDRDHYRQVSRELATELARAQEVIEKVRRALPIVTHGWQIRKALADYDEKGQQS